MSEPTYLQVPFAEKDQAKALGARWDPAQRLWYAPPGLELAPFAPWLPAGAGQAGLSLHAAAPMALEEAQAGSSVTDLAPLQGIGLAQLLHGVARVVAAGFGEPVWTRVEVLRVSGKNGHIYLELTERDPEGRVLAKAVGTLWASVAQRVLPEFERATGVQLAPGIQLLVLARPVFKAQYGFSIDISGIDPSYTLGRLEAHKREIRQALQAEGVFERNRQLPAPWTYARVLVLAPQDAAGLGDFDAEARRLQRASLCEFIYLHSRFQGEGAAAEMLQALRTQALDGLDALIIIRGGGAVNDLAWLNDLALARWVCTCPVPVLTGIGHERDSTILDEVAHHSFDTPSKVAAAIEQRIVQRSQEAEQHFQRIVAQTQADLQHIRLRLQQLQSNVRDAARQSLAQAGPASTARLGEVRLAAQAQLHQARAGSRAAALQVRDAAAQQLHQARQGVPAALAQVQGAAQAQLRLARSELVHLGPSVLQRAGDQAAQASQRLHTVRDALVERSRLSIQQARAHSEALMREVAGQGPQKTLARGFAVVRSSQGQPVMTARSAAAAGALQLQFADGQIPARVTTASAPAPTDPGTPA